PPGRAPARGSPAYPRRGDRADRAPLRREAHRRPGALLLPGEPDPAPLPPPRAPVRERPDDAGHLLEHHRARLPERRLPDPARHDTLADRAAAPAARRPSAPAHASALPGRLPAPAALHHHAARLRPLALLRGHQVLSGRGHELRLPSHPVGGQRGAGRGRPAVPLLSARSRRALGLARLGRYALLDPAGARHAEVAREMAAASGVRRLFLPTLDFEPYREKPPGYYWLVALAYGALGVGEAGARAVSALAALVAVLALYAHPLPRWGLPAALRAGAGAATRPGGFGPARSGDLHMTLTARL